LVKNIKRERERLNHLTLHWHSSCSYPGHAPFYVSSLSADCIPDCSHQSSRECAIQVIPLSLCVSAYPVLIKARTTVFNQSFAPTSRNSHSHSHRAYYDLAPHLPTPLNSRSAWCLSLSHVPAALTVCVLQGGGGTVLRNPVVELSGSEASCCTFGLWVSLHLCTFKGVLEVGEMTVSTLNTVVNRPSDVSSVRIE
jgi:hypothetical protein